MTYMDRLLVPAYTSPVTETRTTWRYRANFTSEFQKRLDSRRYVGLDGVYHVDLGYDGRDYPMACVFDGPDHDIEARDFVTTLLESTKDQPGFLEHPVDGVIPVVVDSGRVTHDPANDAGETIVEVLFQNQTLPPEVEQNAPTISVEKQFGDLRNSISADFDALAFLDTAKGKLEAVKAATNNLNKISQTVSRVSRGISGITTQINLIQDDVLRNIDTIVKTPAILGDQLQQMVGTVAAIPGNISDRIDAWGELYGSSRPGDGDFVYPSDENRNGLANRELTCTSCVGNMLADIGGNVDTFSSALDAMNTLMTAQELQKDLEAFLADQQSVYDENIFQKQYIGQRETLDQLGLLSQLAADAVRGAAPLIGTKITVVLDRDYDILNFAYKYYGNVDDATLNQIIDTNLLSLDDLVLLQKGQEILI